MAYPRLRPCLGVASLAEAYPEVLLGQGLAACPEVQAAAYPEGLRPGLALALVVACPGLASGVGPYPVGP
jgi:hypothetical protein